MTRKRSPAHARRRALIDAADFIAELTDDLADMARQMSHGDAEFVRGVRWFGDKLKWRLKSIAQKGRRGP